MAEQRIDGTEDLPGGENLILSASFDKGGEAPGRLHREPDPLSRPPQGRWGAASGRSPGCSRSRVRVCASAATAGESVTADYPGDHPYAFTGGTIKRAAVDVSGDRYVDLEREAQVMIAREQATRNGWRCQPSRLTPTNSNALGALLRSKDRTGSDGFDSTLRIRVGACPVGLVL